LLWRLLWLLLRGITRLRLIIPGCIILLLRLVLIARAWRIAAATAEQPGQEAAAALLAGAILLLLSDLVGKLGNKALLCFGNPAWDESL